MREWNAKNRDRINAQDRARRTEAHLIQERAWREANREKVRGYKKAYYLKHQEYCVAKAKEWREAHFEEFRDAKNARERERYWRDVEKTRARYRERRQENHAEELARELAYRERHRQELRQYMYEFYRRNYEREARRGRHAAQVRRARKQGCLVKPVDLEQVLLRDAGICGICGRPVPPEELSFDHIVPLSRGGPHHIDNLQVAHRVCNFRKGTKLL